MDSNVNLYSLLAALATVAYGFWSTNKQAEASLQLEAAKAVMQAPTPGDALARAETLKGMFPNTFDPDKISGVSDYYRMEFMKLLASRGLNPNQTARLWGEIFENDEFATTPKLIEIITSGNSSSTTPDKAK
jgi:hypothetical protein